MTDEYHVPEELEEQVRRALEGTPAETGSRIAELCEAWPDHADLVRSWHTAHESLRGGVAGTTPPPDIEGYRILEELGQGGFGIVYLAEADKNVQRRVALKVLREGMDTGQVVARFRAEQQAMAWLSHPGIATIFEAGSTRDGRPFFAMEYVRGLPIHRYAAHHQLTERTRLELFCQVCDAVHHAHQRGILHRDLSTNNVLVAEVDGRPMAKVIDFGIAKSLIQPLVPAAAHTRVGQVVGTPGFISPEQQESSALDVDVRSDVYSLGMMLQCVLLGRHTGQGPKDLPREPGWIVARATAESREQRYDGVAQLGEDVQRYLDGQPLAAAPPGWWYRAAKWTVRNKVKSGLGLLAAVAIAIALVQSWVAQTASRRYRALMEPLRLVAASDSLWPVQPERIPELEAWLAEAQPHVEALANDRATSDDHATRVRERREALRDRMADVERGLAAARRAAAVMAENEPLWREALAAIQADPRFGGVIVQRTHGLVPLGPDPDTGLWEFGHPESGAVPQRSANGALTVNRRTSLVFVLLPPGTFTMGAVPGDTLAHADEAPREASVTAVMVSKYEMTQGQWLRLAGSNPSRYAPGVFFGDGEAFGHEHPVENVSWLEAHRILNRHRMTLPTEPQWEYACRAGKRYVFTHDNDVASLSANLGDAGSKSAYPPDTDLEPDVDDGHRAHAPVGRFAPNGFGLHDMLGNVLEWTSTAGDDPAAVRALRGGGFLSTAPFVRCSSRVTAAPSYRNPDVGVRPAFPLASRP